MATHEERLEEVQGNVKRFFCNVDYLRRVRGLTMQDLVRLVSEDGFKISAHAVGRYMGKSKTQYRRASLYYLSAFSLFFGEPIWKLLAVDYEADARG